MPAPERASLTYAFDAYCAWCYGFGPTLRAFAEDNAHRIRIGVVSAGLYTGARALPTAAHPHLSAERGTITQLTGVAFGTGHEHVLSRGTTVLDSAAAAAGPAPPLLTTLRSRLVHHPCPRRSQLGYLADPRASPSFSARVHSLHEFGRRSRVSRCAHSTVTALRGVHRGSAHDSVLREASVGTDAATGEPLLSPKRVEEPECREASRRSPGERAGSEQYRGATPA